MGYLRSAEVRTNRIFIILLGAILALAPTQGWGQAPHSPIFLDGASYPSAHFKTSDLAFWDTLAGEAGWIRLDGKGRGNIPFLFADQVYLESSLQKAVVFKAGIYAVDTEQKNLLIESPDGIAFLTRSVSGAPAAFFFGGFTLNEATQFVQHVFKTSIDYAIDQHGKRVSRLSQSDRSRGIAWLQKIQTLFNIALLPQALASDQCTIKGQGSENLGRDLFDAMGSLVRTQMSPNGQMSCFVDALKGLWDSLNPQEMINSVMSAGGEFVTFVNHQYGWTQAVSYPPGAVTAFFAKKAGNFVRALWGLASHFNTIAPGFLHSIRDHPQQLISFICKIAGGLSVDAVMALLTDGAGAAKLLARVPEMLLLARRFEKFAGLLEIVEGASSTIMQTKVFALALGEAKRVSYPMLRAVEDLRSFHLNTLAREALECALP